MINVGASAPAGRGRPSSSDAPLRPPSPPARRGWGPANSSLSLPEGARRDLLPPSGAKKTPPPTTAEIKARPSVSPCESVSWPCPLAVWSGSQRFGLGALDLATSQLRWSDECCTLEFNLEIGLEQTFCCISKTLPLLPLRLLRVPLLLQLHGSTASAATLVTGAAAAAATALLSLKVTAITRPSISARQYDAAASHGQ